MTEDMRMSKAMRQMPERSGRVSVAHGEAVRDLASDEACGPPREHPPSAHRLPAERSVTDITRVLTN